jgi:tetratricopeptide (TPR) repeat protein
MKVNSSFFRVILALAILVALPSSMVAQRKGGGGASKPGLGASIPSTTTQPTTTTQPVFISGKVLMDGGAVPPEPVVIERVCNGSARRQGYTDGKGSFQIQLDQNVGFQDASESTTTADPFSNPAQMTNRASDALKLRYQGCEIRAVLPGFLSSSVALRLQGSSWQYDLGTIFLKRMENMPGTTISMTTMNAPNDAKRAYEKGRKAFDESKFPDAEKDLNKAVKIYPSFAAAWSLLGDVHQQEKQFDQATKEYTQALSVDPRFVNPSFGLALIAVQEKRWQDAVQFTDQVAKMNSLAFPSAYFYNAVANYNLGRMEPAAESARKFKSLDTEHHHPDICLLLSQILIQKNDFASAAQEMRDFLVLAPNSPKAGQIREWLKHYDETHVARQQQ